MLAHYELSPLTAHTQKVVDAEPMQAFLQITLNLNNRFHPIIPTSVQRRPLALPVMITAAFNITKNWLMRKTSGDKTKIFLKANGRAREPYARRLHETPPKCTNYTATPYTLIQQRSGMALNVGRNALLLLLDGATIMHNKPSPHDVA